MTLIMAVKETGCSKVFLGFAHLVQEAYGVELIKDVDRLMWCIAFSEEHQTCMWHFAGQCRARKKKKLLNLTFDC